MNYNQIVGDLQINRVAGEAPTTIAETPVPLRPSAGRYRFVVEAFNDVLFYLEMSAGTHSSGVRSDDGFKLTSGASLTDTNGALLGQEYSGTFDGTFDFAVEQSGLYPFRFVWFERGGGAHVELFSMDPVTGTRTLINDTNNVIKAFRSVAAPSIVLESAATLGTGGFAADNSAVVDTNARTVTIARSGAQRFYRLRAGSALTIVSIQIAGANAVLSYQ